MYFQLSDDWGFGRDTLKPGDRSLVLALLVERNGLPSREQRSAIRPMRPRSEERLRSTTLIISDPCIRKCGISHLMNAWGALSCALFCVLTPEID
jgi:hypothetical protein